MIEDDPRFEERIRAAVSSGAGAGPACPQEDSLASFYAGRLGAAEEDAIRDHLATCSACVARARDALAFVDAMSADVGSTPGRRPWPAVAPWALALAAGLGAVAILVFWAVPRGGPGARWRDLVVEKAPVVVDDSDRIVWRGGDGSQEPPPEGSFAWTVEPYVADDFREAARRLGLRLREHPDDDRSRFYLGVSLLLGGDPTASIEPLRSVAESDGALSGDAAWYLALAHLKIGNEDRAEPLLRTLSSRTGERGERARDLLGKVARRPDR